MELEIINRRDNRLFKRVEVTFRVKHPKGATPTRNDVRNLIAGNMGVEVKRVIIDHMKSEFGMPVTKGYAKIYDTVEDAKAIEPDYILIRNGLLERKTEGD
jgi:small subunit ribosomal protein S24e